jgi:hypothetical protein
MYVAYIAPSPRSLAITFLVVILFTSGMFWLNRSDVPLGYVRYDNYGIDLLYPKIGRLQEAGLPGLGYGSEANDFAGLVQWETYTENKLEAFEVIWLVGERSSTPRGDLEKMVDKASGLEAVARLTSDFYISILQGEEVECADLEVVNGNYIFSGVICVTYRQWSSPGVDRILFIVYLTPKDSVSQDQIRTCFQTQLDSLRIEGL